MEFIISNIKLPNAILSRSWERVYFSSWKSKRPFVSNMYFHRTWNNQNTSFTIKIYFSTRKQQSPKENQSSLTSDHLEIVFFIRFCVKIYVNKENKDHSLPYLFLISVLPLSMTARVRNAVVHRPVSSYLHISSEVLLPSSSSSRQGLVIR